MKLGQILGQTARGELDRAVEKQARRAEKQQAKFKLAEQNRKRNRGEIIRYSDR